MTATLQSPGHTQLRPGMKVARRMPHRPDLAAIGVVTPDGKGIIYQEVVDSQGRESNRYGGGFRPTGEAVPIRGDEIPCPQEWQHLLRH